MTLLKKSKILHTACNINVGVKGINIVLLAELIEVVARNEFFL